MLTIGNHAFQVTTARSFDDAVARVTERLAEKGFGVLTEIDVRATLQKKLGVETRPYKILGACNPPFAHRAIVADPTVGVFLPCNVVVRDDGDQRVITAMEPRIMSAILEHPELRAVADEVSAMLHDVLSGLD